MKKLLLLLATVLTVVALTATPAFASKLKVSASARQRATNKVVFTAKPSRHARVRVTVYRHGHRVRRLSAKRVGRRYVATWKGRSVTAGTYTYKVTAVTSYRRRTTRGKIKVVAPAPPTTTPTTTTPVPPTTTPTSATVTPPSTTPTSTTPVPPSTTPTSTTPPPPTPTAPPTAPVDPNAPVSPMSLPYRWIGMWQPYAASDMSVLAATEAAINTHEQVIQIFMNDGEGGFPLGRCQNIVNHKSTPLITLGLNVTENGGPSVITAGASDAYLKKYAADAKAFGHEVWLRPFHEMNGNWYPWSGTGTSTPAEVVAAWKHVKTIFAEQGATNVKFVWCPNGESVPNTAANGIAKYWPGDAYVDYVAIDAYNAGTLYTWSHWQTIGDSMGPAYATVTGLTNKPLFLAETSSTEKGGSKAAWIADFFQSIRTKYTRVRGVVWFNEKNSSDDWRIDSSPESLASFRAEATKGF